MGTKNILIIKHMTTHQEKDTIPEGFCRHGNILGVCPICKDKTETETLPQNYYQKTIEELEAEYHKRSLVLTNTEARFEHHGLSVMGYPIPAEYYRNAEDEKDPNKKIADVERFTQDLLIAGLLRDDFQHQGIKTNDQVDLISVRNNVRTGAFMDIDYKGIGFEQVFKGKKQKMRYPLQELKAFRKSS